MEALFTDIREHFFKLADCDWGVSAALLDDLAERLANEALCDEKLARQRKA